MEQREIKFRGQRSDNGKWVTGSYHSSEGSAILHSHDYYGKAKEADVVLNKHWILTHNLPSSPGWTISDTYSAYSVLPETVGQYTGLKDKNGVEVYEGDVVEVHVFTQELGYSLGVTEGEEIFKGVIEFWHYGIGLNVGDDENNFYLVLAPGMLHEESFEILGNKFCNPELTQQS